MSVETQQTSPAADDVPAPDKAWLQPIVTGLVVALVGYASSVAVVVHGLAAVGASQDEIASALVGLSAGMFVAGAALSLRTRMPISVAWTTPGMALLASTGAVDGGFPAAVGAFVVTGLAVVVAGLWPPLGRLVAAIPRSLASGMLAGILLKLCLAPFAAASSAPWLVLAVFVTWVVVGRLARLYAVPAAVAVALLLIAFDGSGSGGTFGAFAFPALTLVTPLFTTDAVIGIAVPLFIVTMASQNIPGAAVLAANGYRPDVRPAFALTGLLSAATALIGSPTINLAAITAALCAGPDAHPDPRRRYVAAVVAAIGYALLGLLAAVTASVVTRSPPVLIEAVAGLALFGAFAAALLAAVEDEKDRIPAVTTFLVAASGLTIGGVGGAFWGLLIGAAMRYVHLPRRV